MAKQQLIIQKGRNGWGGPLTLDLVTDKKVVSMTGAGIHPVARHIANLAGISVVDGFKEGVKEEDTLCIVINCAGTLRCGIYPKKRIPTINVNPIGQSGPLAEFIKEDIYVSDVKEEHITLVEASANGETAESQQEQSTALPINKSARREINEEEGMLMRLIQTMGTSIGKVTAMLYESGREATMIIIKSVIPFMAFVSALIAIILYTGVGDSIAQILKPLAGSVWGLLIVSVVCGVPLLSPLLGPGAAIAQVIGVLIGAEIGLGHIPPQYALPALFAINVQVGADFVPVGLSMQEAEPETIKYGVPAFLISRQIAGPIAVVAAYLMSFGLFQ